LVLELGEEESAGERIHNNGGGRVESLGLKEGRELNPKQGNQKKKKKKKKKH